MSNFPCTACGLCCQRAGNAVRHARTLISMGETNPYAKEIAAFPYPFDETGRCSQLTADNKCAVYDKRPLICDIEKVWEKYHKPTGAISLDNYFLSAAVVCNTMMKEEGVNENFFIEVGDK
jgi:Fe-S-cluster containining protein